MTIDFALAGLENYAAKINTYAAEKSGKTNEEILEELGIEVKQSGDSMGLDFEDYLQLMVQQLQNQTMDNTMDSSEMLNQLVQMSTVQMMSSLQSTMATIADGVALNYAASLVGKTVTVGKTDSEGNIQEIVGTVTGTGTYQGSMVIFVNDEMYALNSIMAVGTLPEVEEPEKPAEDGGNTGENSGTDPSKAAVSV